MIKLGADGNVMAHGARFQTAPSDVCPVERSAPRERRKRNGQEKSRKKEAEDPFLVPNAYLLPLLLLLFSLQPTGVALWRIKGHPPKEPVLRTPHRRRHGLRVLVRKTTC